MFVVPELVPNAQRDQGKSCLCSSLDQADYDVAGLSFLKPPGKLFCLLLFCHVRRMLVTQVQIFVMPMQVSKSLICSGLVFFKKPWQTREGSLERCQ